MKTNDQILVQLREHANECEAVAKERAATEPGDFHYMNLSEWTYALTMRGAADEIERLQGALDKLLSDPSEVWHELRMKLDAAHGQSVNPYVRGGLHGSLDLLIAERDRLRAALERLAERLECSNANESHYCPNCDNSLYDALQSARAALNPEHSGSETEVKPTYNHEHDCGLTNDAGTCECPQPDIMKDAKWLCSLCGQEVEDCNLEVHREWHRQIPHAEVPSP